MAAIAPSILFNSQWYLNQNPDVAEAVRQGLTTAEEHFRLYGNKEGRAADPLFNPQEYLAANPDVAAAVEAGLMTAYDHFVQHGAAEGRSPLSLFDPEFYLSQNPDVAAAVEAGLMSAVEHFLMHGQSEPRQVTPFINLADYLRVNQDVAAAVGESGLAAFSHLLANGAAEGRDLGNGVNLAVFANDPAFQEAIGGGDLQAALARVSDVAPFLPTFEAPEGWTPHADTPIPTDFTPPAGTQLVIPPSVVVPPGTELPDTFVPVEPDPEPAPPPASGANPGGSTPPPPDVITKIGTTLSETASRKAADPEKPDTMWNGSGNSNENFSISTSAASGFEVALKGYKRNTGDTEPVSTSPHYSFKATDRAGFAYSLATLDGKTLKEKLDNGYSVYLNIDLDSGPDVSFARFKLAAEVRHDAPDVELANDSKDDTPSPDSGYQWERVGHQDVIIVDDQGAPTTGAYSTVTQNIQTPFWYSPDLQLGNTNVLKGGDYDISLQVFNDQIDSENAIVEQTISLNVEAMPILLNGNLSSFATKGNAGIEMLNGTGNPASNFAVHQIKLDEDAAGPVLEIALGAQQRHGEVYDLQKGLVRVEHGEAPTFKYSVATNGSKSLEQLLEVYDIRLSVDIEPSAATNFIVLQAEHSTSDKTGALDWTFVDHDDITGEYTIIDDQGNAKVSQNIEVLRWFQPDDSKALFPGVNIDQANPGLYTVALEVFHHGTLELVGATELSFHVLGELT